MHPDLARLIRLQQLDTAADAARRTIAEHPQRLQALDTLVDTARQAVADARQRLSENQTKRREAEKELAVVQGRLTKFKDQLLDVKTNREYQAVQHEIATAQEQNRAHEDGILELMLQADDLNAQVKKAEAELSAVEKSAAADRAVLERELADLHGEITRSAEARAALTPEIAASVLAAFELIASKRGVAVAQARNGLCTICHVRLRPQVFNDIRRNEAIIQCDSCQRILYFDAAAGAAPAAAEASSDR